MDLYDKIIKDITSIRVKNLTCYDDIHEILNSLKNFIEGKGTLEGIPTGND